MIKTFLEYVEKMKEKEDSWLNYSDISFFNEDNYKIEFVDYKIGKIEDINDTSYDFIDFEDRVFVREELLNEVMEVYKNNNECVSCKLYVFRDNDSAWLVNGNVMCNDCEFELYEEFMIDCFMTCEDNEEGEVNCGSCDICELNYEKFEEEYELKEIKVGK